MHREEMEKAEIREVIQDFIRLGFHQ